jgi:hypothetical protein
MTVEDRETVINSIPISMFKQNSIQVVGDKLKKNQELDQQEFCTYSLNVQTDLQSFESP